MCLHCVKYLKKVFLEHGVLLISASDSIYFIDASDLQILLYVSLCTRMRSSHYEWNITAVISSQQGRRLISGVARNFRQGVR